MMPAPSDRRPRLRIATRGSRLALAQAGLVAAELIAAHPAVETELVVVRTTGDADERPFATIGGKGLFTAEIERALVDGEADIAVHSAKDLTADLAPGCRIGAVVARTHAADVVVGGTGENGLERLLGLPAGARVGTSSMRRRALLRELRSDLEVVELRGNVDTRLRKVADGVVDAAILAAAGLARLGADADAATLDEKRWIPAPGQGALAVEVLDTRRDVAELLEALDDPSARTEVELERSFARTIEGGCSIPLGCLARRDGDKVTAVGFVGSPRTGHCVRAEVTGEAGDGATLGQRLALDVLDAGGSDVMEELAPVSAPAVPEP